MFKPRLYVGGHALAGILMIPNHVKLAPPRVRRIVGTLSQTQTVLQALGPETLAA